jgi:diguanylate cyclase (GGDEF)-like protein
MDYQARTGANGGNGDTFSQITVGEMLEASEPLTVFEHDVPFLEVLHHVAQHSPDTVIIVREGMPAGILTLKDIVAGLGDMERLTEPVNAFMSAPLHIFETDRKVSEVLECMEQAAYHKIVVVDAAQRRILGIIDARYLTAMLCQKISPLIKHYDNDIRLLLNLVGERTESLLEMATTDELTGIANRRLFTEIFHSHQAVSQRFDSTLFLMIADIDNFKAINDSYGHVVGDRILKTFAGLIGSHIRAADVLARWGGDEFVFLLHITKEEGVRTTAEHLRQVIAAHCFEPVGQLTSSFGVVKVGREENLETLIALADEALYKVKKGGKNAIAFANE